MLEYLIRRADDEWFSFPFDQYPEILRPARTPSKQVKGWGSNRIEVEGEEISFSDEDPSFQVVFETGTLPEERADQIVSEICANIEARTGQRAVMVKL
jgi:hypothetical protein